MVAQGCNPSLQKTKAGQCELKARLATQWGFVLEKWEGEGNLGKERGGPLNSGKKKEIPKYSPYSAFVPY